MRARLVIVRGEGTPPSYELDPANSLSLGRSRGQLEPTRALLVGVVFNSFASAVVLSVESILQPSAALTRENGVEKRQKQ